MRTTTRGRARKKPAIQYTVRAVPPEVDRVLRAKAKREQRSLNDVLVEALRRGAAAAAEPRRYHDLDHLAGTWKEDPEFDAIIAAQDQVDPDLWR